MLCHPRTPLFTAVFKVSTGLQWKCKQKGKETLTIDSHHTHFKEYNPPHRYHNEKYSYTGTNITFSGAIYSGTF